MECREAEELIAPYLLGALDAHEAAGVDRHIDGCLECSTKLREEGDIVVGLAYASPQMEVPARVKTRLLSRIAEETVRRRSPRAVLDWQRLVPSLTPNPPKDTDGRREGSGRGWVRELQGRWPGVLG